MPDLKSLFAPESIAVVGASRSPGKVGHAVLENLKTQGFAGRLYPVNPKAGEIEGLQCFPDLKSLPETPDLAIFIVPPPAIIAAFADPETPLKSAVVISAGFKETGTGGAARERELKALAAERRVRVLGPNCLGLINPHHKMNASFAAHLPPAGNIAFFSQSGALCTAVLDWAIQEGIGFSQFISLGNKMDVDETDLLLALAADPATDVILGYLEGISDGRRFIDAAAEVSRKKPVIITKSGTTAAGAKAASSHTGTLAGSERAYQAAFERSGIVRAETVEQLFDFALAFSAQPLPPGPRVAVLTNAGGPGIVTADAVEHSRLSMASLSKEGIERLRAGLPDTAALYNPVDVIGDAAADRYERALAVLDKEPDVDAVIVLLTPQAPTDAPGTARAVAARKGGGKSYLASFMGGESVAAGRRLLQAGGVPNYPYPERAVCALEAMADLAAWRRRPPATAPAPFAADKRQVELVFREARLNNQLVISDFQARGVFGAYGLKFPRSVLAPTLVAAREAARDIGYPVVLKIASPEIVHKSDVGGVRVGIGDDTALEQAYFSMLMHVREKLPGVPVAGVEVQEMVRGGRELILGVSRDPQFGPLVMFGLGGIYVEVFQDVSFALAPLDQRSAGELLERIKMYPLLRGVRGESPCDLEAIKETLLRVSQLVADFPRILELDVNPLLAMPAGQGAVAIDCRLTIAAEQESREEKDAAAAAGRK